MDMYRCKYILDGEFHGYTCTAVNNICSGVHHIYLRILDPRNYLTSRIFKDLKS